MRRKYELLKLLYGHNIDYKDKGSNVMKGCIAINCPICKNDPSFHLNITTGLTFAKCLICGYKETDSIEIIRNAILPESHLTFTEAISALNQYPYEDGDYDTPDVETEKVPEIYFIDIWNSFKPLVFPYTVYLTKRGLVLQFCENLGVKTGTIYTLRRKQHSFLRRIIFPIREPGQGKIVNFLGRSVMPNAYLRYKNCPNELSIVDAEGCLFGLWESQGLKGNYMVVVEGIIDCLKLLQNGIRGVALMKKVITDKQMELLSDYLDKDTLIFTFLDSDANDRDWKDIILKLSLHFSNIKTVHLEGLKDVGDASQEDINLLWSILETQFPKCGVNQTLPTTNGKGRGR